MSFSLQLPGIPWRMSATRALIWKTSVMMITTIAATQRAEPIRFRIGSDCQYLNHLVMRSSFHFEGKDKMVLPRVSKPVSGIRLICFTFRAFFALGFFQAHEQRRYDVLCHQILPLRDCSACGS